MKRILSSYREGFEDAIELCIAEVQDTTDIKSAIKKMRGFLALVKEDKLDKIKRELGAIS